MEKTACYLISTSNADQFSEMCKNFENWAKEKNVPFKGKFSTASFVLMQESEIPAGLQRMQIPGRAVQQVPVVVFSMFYVYEPRDNEKFTVSNFPTKLNRN